MSRAAAATPRPPSVDHFATGGVRADLSRLSARGGIAMFGAQVLVLALTVGSTVVLARLLEPRDFGLLAMSMTLINFARTFKDGGFANATVHHSDLDHAQASTAFWINLLTSIVLAAATAALAPLIALFYGEPDLMGMTLVMTIGVFALAVSAIHLGLLRRQLRFDALARNEVIAAAVGVAAAIALALAGAGYWALVAQVLVFNLTQAVGLWLSCRWRPGRRRERLGRNADGVRQMRAFGRDVAWTRLSTYVGGNADFVLVGRFAGAGSLGLYEKAFAWSFLPFRQIHSPLVNVAVSGLSRLQDDTARYRAFFRAAVRSLFILVFPAIAFLMVEAREVVLVLLGDQWLEAVPLVRILLVAAFVSSITRITSWVYLSEGRTRRQLHWNLISTPILAGAVALGVVWGVTGVAVAYAVSAGLLTLPALQWCLRGSRLRLSDIVRALGRAALAAALAGAGTLALQPAIDGLPAAVDLCASAGAFLVLYGLVFAATAAGRAEAREVVRLLGAARRRGPDAGGVQETA